MSNRGGRLWVMGSKFEGNGLRFIARKGDSLELDGKNLRDRIWSVLSTSP